MNDASYDLIKDALDQASYYLRVEADDPEYRAEELLALINKAIASRIGERRRIG